MFPPVEEHILQRNPEFAKLYRTLTTITLNPDGSTQNHPEAKDRLAVNKALEKHRLKTVKHHLLERAIATATPSDSKPPTTARVTRAAGRLQQKQNQSASDGLPEPLLDLLLILPPFLDAANTLPHDSVALLLSSPPLSDFQSLLPGLADLISTNLHTSVLSLARLAHPSSNPTFLHRHISSLPQDLADLNDKLSTAEQSLAAARLHTLATLTSLLQIYSQCLTHLIRSLEVKHGVIARSLELRATNISLQAQITEKQAEQKMWRLRRDVYTTDVVSALHTYMSHLRDAKIRGAEKVRGLKAELEGYGVTEGGGGDGKQLKLMKEMAKTYRELGQQVEDVEKDIERLRVTS
ncbi:hypothetical protein PT974_02713 [Cladobotryum mycophilum]|uniref:HAUS augmin-like complex subunit 1 n=1 Tax=Cladobotryum mycophilum TaxID=491253 RepID=A0ABR0SZ30_9HYPO